MPHSGVFAPHFAPQVLRVRTRNAYSPDFACSIAKERVHTMDNMQSRKEPVSFGRHRRNCSVCAHPQRLEIESEFIAWRSPTALAQQYGLADRASVYRHAHALGLFARRQRNVRAALEQIIEKAGDVEVTAYNDRASPQMGLFATSSLKHVGGTQSGRRNRLS